MFERGIERVLFFLNFGKTPGKNFSQALIFGSFHQGKEHDKKERLLSCSRMNEINEFCKNIFKLLTLAIPIKGAEMNKLTLHLIFVFIILFSSTIVAQNNPLAMGTYTTGSAGYFPTIDSAFSKLSNDGISGAVTLELIDTFYQAPNNSYFALEGPISGAGPNSGITIKPAANKNVTIEGYGFALLFSDISYLTLDGVGLTGATTLTVHALSDTLVGIDNGVNIFHGNSGVNIIHNSDHNVIQNITAITEDYVTLNSSGISILQLDATSSDGPDNNLIQNNFIKKAGTAIRMSATGQSAAFAQGNIIKDNFIGSQSDSLILWGIFTGKTKNTIIEGNIIQNMKVVGDIIQNLRFDINNIPTGGIILNWSYDGIIRNNIVHNIKSLSVECTGIVIGSYQPQYSKNNLVYNNMVYDIQSVSTQNVGNDNRKGSATFGILVFGQYNPQIYYNSVYLTGTGNGANHAGSAALWIDNPYSSSSTNVVIKNNILVNARDESPYSASSIYDYSISNLTSENNDLLVLENQNNCLVKISGTKYNTLADWQIKGKDLNSITEMPNFKSPDLHIDESIPTNLESHGTPVAGIEVDFDEEDRQNDSTDIGADEFNGTIIVGVKDKVTHPLKFTLKQNYPNPFNPTTSIEFMLPKTGFTQLKVYNVLGKEVATLISQRLQRGRYTFSFTAENLASGIYYYHLQSGQNSQVKKMLLVK